MEITGGGTDIVPSSGVPHYIAYIPGRHKTLGGQGLNHEKQVRQWMGEWGSWSWEKRLNGLFTTVLIQPDLQLSALLHLHPLSPRAFLPNLEQCTLALVISEQSFRFQVGPPSPGPCAYSVRLMQRQLRHQTKCFKHYKKRKRDGSSFKKGKK